MKQVKQPVNWRKGILWTPQDEEEEKKPEDHEGENNEEGIEK